MSSINSKNGAAILELIATALGREGGHHPPVGAPADPAGATVPGSGPTWAWKGDGEEPPCTGCTWESHCGRYATACTAWAQYAGLRRVRARRIPSGLLAEVEARSEARSELRRRARQ